DYVVARGRDGTHSGEQVLEALPPLLWQGVEPLGGADRILQLHLHLESPLLDHPFTHVGALGHDAHPRGPEDRRVTDARPLQQHRALDGATRDEDLFLGAEILHASLTLGPYSHDPLPVEQQVRGPDARHDLEVAPAPGRAQEGTRRRRTPAVPDA